MNAMYDMFAIPFGFVMEWFYAFFNNYFVALFLLTLLVKLCLLPSSISQQKGSAKQTRLQPKINRIRQRYSNGGQPSREIQMKIQEETQALYQKEGYSPMSGGCLPLLIQFPVMIGLYGVVNTPLSKVLGIPKDIVAAAASAMKIDTATNEFRYELTMLSELTEGNIPAQLETYAEDILSLKEQFIFGSINLTGTPSWKEPGLLWIIPGAVLVLGLITSLIMFRKQKQTNPEMAKNPSMGCMTFMSPLMSVWFTFLFPAAVGVYWILSSFFTLIQTVVLNYTHNPQKVIARTMIDETVERRSREANIKKLKEFSENNTES